MNLLDSSLDGDWMDTIDVMYVDTSDDCEYDYDLIEEYELDDYDEV